jgi:hypothetical protein
MLPIAPTGRALGGELKKAGKLSARREPAAPSHGARDAAAIQPGAVSSDSLQAGAAGFRLGKISSRQTELVRNELGRCNCATLQIARSNADATKKWTW